MEKGTRKTRRKRICGFAWTSVQKQCQMISEAIHCFGNIFPVGAEGYLALLVGLFRTGRKFVRIKNFITVAQMGILVTHYPQGAVCIRKHFCYVRRVEGNSEKYGDELFQQPVI